MKIKALTSRFWVNNVKLKTLLKVFLRVQLLTLPNPEALLSYIHTVVVKLVVLKVSR
jgi:hypothetical protein